MMNAKKTVNVRMILIRAVLCVLWVSIGIVIFVFFRGHTLLVDNRNIEEASIRAPDLITVYVNKEKGLEFFRGDRDRFTVSGSRHSIRVEFSDGRPPFETAFALPIRDDTYILSVPRMINGIDPFVEVFQMVPEPRAPEEEELPGEEEAFTTILSVPPP
jgi:hypothetical protein